MPPENKKRIGRPPKPKTQQTVVQRPIKDGRPVNPETWDGRFQSVEPLDVQKPARQKRYKWNHYATINWIMGQADPVGFLAAVMQGKEMFPVYTKDPEGIATKSGKIAADPELRVLAARTLLGKCVPDLKAVEIKAQVQQTRVLDINRITDDDLDTIERVLERAIIDGSESGEDEEIVEGIYQEILGND